MGLTPSTERRIMTETKIEPHYQQRAKHLVDLLFDKGLFKESVSRDDMQAVEDLIAFEYQSSADSVERAVKLLQKIKG